jgi:hypothetical protein
MSLQDFVISREEVAFRGGTIAVRGLALNDITSLMRNHIDEVSTLFRLYDKEETRETAMAQSAQFALTIVQQTPEMVAMLIVLASDSPPEDLAKAERLSLSTQVELLRNIIELTFEEAGGAKKFIDGLMSMVSILRPTAIQD